MGRRKEENRIGVEFTTNEGYQVIVIDYVNFKNVQVMFLDDYKWTTWTQWISLQNGEIKNPFHKSVYGVGYLGTDENGERQKAQINGKQVREYQVWHDMLKRCYDEKFHERQPTYKNCTVCERWHNYSLFLEDLPKIKNYEFWRDNPQQKIALNKDIYYSELGIDMDCKEYSLETTRFITGGDNTREMLDRCKPTLPKKVRCIELNIIFDSLGQAERETGVSYGSIGKVCQGLRKTAGGYHWEFVE